ncbi:hypothetical protein TNCV_4491891 [Trichonephila clavipes]|nr:hypothetical protein TNCV_4491891 [Trichonephila clavipes]
MPTQGSSSSLDRDSTLRDGRGILLVKVTDSWPACPEFEPCTTEDLPCIGYRCTLNVEAQTFSRWCGVEVRRGRCSLIMVQNYEVRS